jgi:hypothetical protein
MLALKLAKPPVPFDFYVRSPTSPKHAAGHSPARLSYPLRQPRQLENTR